MIYKLIFVFVGAVITEGVYTCFTYYVARGDLTKGPISAGLLGIFKAALVIAYVREPIMIIALAVGQACGTWLTLRFIVKKRA